MSDDEHSATHSPPRSSDRLDSNSPTRSDDRPHHSGTPKRSNWRLECKFVALTYPNCAVLDHDELFTWLSGSITPKPDFLVLSRELHLNGVPHFHGLLYFAGGIRTRNARFFDFGGRHPNVQSVRDPAAWYQYCCKDGDCRKFGTVPPKLEGTDREQWGKCLASSTTRDEFLGNVRSAAPRDFVLFHDRIVSFADQHFKKTEIYVGPEVDFRVPNELSEWCRENLEEVSIPVEFDILKSSFPNRIMSRLRTTGQKASSSKARPVRVKQLGPDRWEITHTCAGCGTATTSDLTAVTSSWTTLTSSSSQTGRYSSVVSDSSPSPTSTEASEQSKSG